MKRECDITNLLTLKFVCDSLSLRLLEFNENLFFCVNFQGFEKWAVDLKSSSKAI